MTHRDRQSRQFRAPWSKTLIGLSLFSTAVILGVGLLMLGLANFVSNFLIIEGVLVLAVLPISALYVVRGYHLDGDRLLIQRLLWKTEVPLSDLHDIYHDPSAMSKSLRTFGNGGCLSFTGWFCNKQLGHYRAFATSAADSVVLVFRSRRTIVITPERPDEFVSSVRRQMNLDATAEHQTLAPAMT